MNSQPKKVVLVTNIPTPYRIPLFNEIHHQLAQVGISFLVIFAALGYERRKWKIDMDKCAFSWEVLPPGRIATKNPEHAIFTYRGVTRVIKRIGADLVVVSGFSLGTLKIWFKSFLDGPSYLIWSGGIPTRNDSRLSFGNIRGRWFATRAVACIAYGKLAKQKLVSLGAAPAKVSIGINTVDTEFFYSAAAGRAFGVPKTVWEFVALGDLSIRKRPDLLLQAMSILSKSRKNFVLRFIGDGPERPRLEAMVKDLGIPDRVVFEGYKQKPEVAAALAKSDCFLFPTNFDIWGLVLVEAMASGLICLSSIRAGATQDLIQEGITGFAVDFQEPAAVADRLLWIMDNPEEASEISRNARELIRREVSIPKSASGFKEAILRGLSSCGKLQ